ncbi:uncharacterized protein TNCV_1068301 [Trichonephila clavipes]|nr:uncharacterized protein TNCV_1068301 [Trichonephila clavipes]
MPVVSAPCSCQPDCLVCGRGDVSTHDCAIHVLLESMVFQEGMLYGEPTEARLEEILQSGKEYLPRAIAFAPSEPKDVSSDYVEQEASKGKGAFIQALWTLYAKSSLYRLAYKAWKRHGPQNLTTWTLLAHTVLDGCYAEKWPDTVFQVPDVCSICLSPMHWPEKTRCGHGFHLQYLLQHLDVSNTCPFLQGAQPIENILETVMSPRQMGELERSIALDQFSHFFGLL